MPTLKCSTNNDGSVNGHIEVNGIVNPNYVVSNGDCDDIQGLATAYLIDFGISVTVDPDCAAVCFGPGKIDS